MVKLWLLTGARRDEIAGARWSEIDLVGKALTIAKERSKNGAAHEMPAVRLGHRDHRGLATRRGEEGRVRLRVLDDWRDGRERLFASEGPLDAAFVEALQDAAEARGDDPSTAAPLPDWTFHDLRRSLATNLQKLGVRLEVTEAVLNHVSGSRGGIVGVNQRHDWADEKRQALDAWARRLSAIVDDDPELAASRRTS